VAEKMLSHICNPLSPDRFDQPALLLSLAIGPNTNRLNGQSDEHENNSGNGGSGTAVISKPKSQTVSNTKTPRSYRVIIMNDDYTPMDFVILVLQKFFSKDIAEATQIMLSVHTKGSGVCGTFTFEIAETKVYQVNRFSASNHHPLKCIMEKA